MAIADLSFDDIPDAADKRKKPVRAQDLSFEDIPTQRTLVDAAGRSLGLAGRDVVEGLMGIPNMIGNGVNAAINLPIRGINAVAGTSIPTLGMPSEATSSLLTRAGLPKPETGPEQFASSINRAVVGFSPMQAGANLATGAAKSIPFVNSMLTKPVAELATVATGAGASDLTRQAGGGEIAQAVAGMAAPMGIQGAANIVGRGATAVNELRRPVTQKGAEQIAADLVGKLASDKGNALKNLQKYNQLVESGATVGVPGAKPTAGMVSADYGLIGSEQAISRGDASHLFSQQFAKNNEAVAADLGKLNATDKALEAYRVKRDNITAPMREAAFDNAKGPVDFGPVALKLGEVAGTAEGGRVESQKALSWIAKRIEEYNSTPGRNDARNAYALHQDIGDLIKGKITDSNGSALKLAGGLANDVKNALAVQINDAAPGFKQYMAHYSKLSKPIDRLEVITERLGGQDLSKVTNAAISATENGGSYTVSQAKMKNQLANIKDETKLAPRQSDILERVMGHLNASNLALSGGKRPGADTYQNMASANLLNRVLGETLAQTGAAKLVSAPLNFAYRPLESRINEVVVKAHQDPKFMEELLRKARTSRQSPTLAGLLSETGQSANAGLLGSLFSH